MLAAVLVSTVRFCLYYLGPWQFLVQVKLLIEQLHILDANQGVALYEEIRCCDTFFVQRELCPS